MKPFLWLALFVAGQTPLMAQANDAAIEGSVVRSGTAERLSNVAIVARSEENGVTTDFPAQTDAQGSFVFEKLPAGNYTVIPQRRGYSLPPNGAERITARNGERIRNLTLSLVRDSAIHGSVLQADGQPAAGISVELVEVTHASKALKIVMPSGPRMETGTNGEYRFKVDPGEYYVRTVTTPGGPQARTYFPNTFNPGEAKAIRVSPEEDVSADIHIAMTPVFKITGRIVDLLPDREPHYFSGVSLSSKSSTVREYKLQNATEGIPLCCDVIAVPDSNVSVTLSKDRFEIRGVRPGSYGVDAGILVGDLKPGDFVFTKTGDRAPYSRSYGGRTTVEVTNADVADIKVEVRHGVDLKGRIVSNGKAVTTNETDIFLRPADYDPPYSFEIFEVDKAGRFAFGNLLDGDYSLDVGYLPGDAYVVEIRQGARKLSGTDFTISSAKPEPLEIIVNPSGGKIDGHVPNGGQASIILMPTEGQTRYDPLPIRRASESGDFTFRGVPPGKYRIFAFISLPAEVSTGAVPISDFIGPYETQGTPLEVTPGAGTEISLTLISPSVK